MHISNARRTILVWLTATVLLLFVLGWSSTPGEWWLHPEDPDGDPNGHVLVLQLFFLVGGASSILFCLGYLINQPFKGPPMRKTLATLLTWLVGMLLLFMIVDWTSHPYDWWYYPKEIPATYRGEYVDPPLSTVIRGYLFFAAVGSGFYWLGHYLNRETQTR